MESGILQQIPLHWTLFFLGILTLSVNGLLPPICDMDISDAHVNDVITLYCKMASNESSANVTLTWYHDGKNISLDLRGGVVRTKLSNADFGVNFTCEARDVNEVSQSCTVSPLALVIPTPRSTPGGSTPGGSTPEGSTPGSTSAIFTETTPEVTTNGSDLPHPHDGTIEILFIAIVVAGGVPILIAIIGCIAWISRKTKSNGNSYTLRPRSDSFDDFDPETAVDNRPAAPLPGEMKPIQNGKSSMHKEKEFPTYSNPPNDPENLYQNTGMGHSTLPVATTGKNIYLVPKSSPAGSSEGLVEENAKIYENTGFGSKQSRFEADQTASLPNFRY